MPLAFGPKNHLFSTKLYLMSSSENNKYHTGPHQILAEIKRYKLALGVYICCYYTCIKITQALTLSESGHKKKEISEKFRITYDRIGATICPGRVSPIRNTVRPPVLTSEQIDELESFEAPGKHVKCHIKICSLF